MSFWSWKFKIASSEEKAVSYEFWTEALKLEELEYFSALLEKIIPRLASCSHAINTGINY